MLTLHYAPDNASLVVRLALEQAGLPYQARLVDRSVSAQKSPEYLALNPAGVIPTLITPDGPVSETAAILLWLVDTAGAAGVGHGKAERGAFLKWLFFVSNSLHADLRISFYPGQYIGPDADHQRALAIGVRARILHHFALLEAVPPCSWFKGDTPSVLDWYVVVARRWAALYGADGGAWLDLDAHPSLQRLALRLDTHPAAKAAARSEGLGACPFSAPAPCTPPEGVAL